MKKLLTFCSLCILCANAICQVPERMGYQAVVRSTSGELVRSQAVGLRLSILKGSITGTVVYEETQNPTTNTNGLFTVQIGNGTVVNGSISGIDWSDDTYFIKTETDPEGGTDYTIAGTSQLIAVPYAFHARTADSLIGGVNEADPVYSRSLASGITSQDTAYWNRHNILIETDPIYSQSVSSGITSQDTAYWNRHTIVVETDPTFISSLAYGITSADTAFWNQKLDHEQDSSITNEIQVISRNGLAVTLSNGGGSYTDSVNVYTAGTNITIKNNVISSRPYFYLGQDTMDGIVFYLYRDSLGIQHGLITAKKDSAGLWQQPSNETVTGATSSWDGKSNMSKMTNSPIKSYVSGLGSAWYIPSNDELSLLWHNRYNVNRGLSKAGYTEIGRYDYWSSTELDKYKAYSFDCATGIFKWSYNKAQSISVRAIRAF